MAAAIPPYDDMNPISTVGMAHQVLRDSRASSTYTSPSMVSSVTGSDVQPRQSRGTQITRRELGSTQSTPTHRSGIRPFTSTVNSPQTSNPAYRSPSPQRFSPVSRWQQIVPAFFALLGQIIAQSFVPADLFGDVVYVCCLCLGQDNTDTLSDAAWSSAYDLLDSLLSPISWRRSQQMLRRIMEGRVIPGNAVAALPDTERKVTRGAIM
jgi:hypothetical protein